MNRNVDLAETFPQQEQEPLEPELRLVEGADALEFEDAEPEATDLPPYKVPDSPDFTEEAGITGDGAEDLPDRHQHAGAQAGRMATSAKLVETTQSKKHKKSKTLEDDFYKSGSGGYWRKLVKWAKENHESDCPCYICGSMYVLVTG